MTASDPADRPPRPGHALQRHASLAIRRAVHADQRYICSTWWHSLLGRNRAPRLRHRINDQIDRVLDDPTTRALVATDHRDRILGWLVYAEAPIGRVIHYCYVRDEEREKGICGRLIAAAWPDSSARVIVTMRGPSTKTYVEQKKAALYVPLEEIIG